MDETAIRDKYLELFSIPWDSPSLVEPLQQLRQQAEDAGLDVWVRLIDVRLLRAQRDFRGGLSLLETVLGSESDNPHALFLKAALLGQDPDARPEAVAVFDALIAALSAKDDFPSRQIVAMALCNKGAALADMDKLQEALAACDDVIRRFANSQEPQLLRLAGWALHNMGSAFAKKGESAKAIECWEKAIPVLRSAGEDAWAKMAEEKIVLARVTPGRRSRRDEAILAAAPMAAPDGRDERPEERIKAKLTTAGGTKYDAYAQQFDADKCEADVLAILRGWGSAVPLLAKSGEACRGGGYLLKWRGKGIAVDPGFDFLNNLHDARFHSRDINAVVVSHNHTDHNDDLRAFDDIRYEMYNRASDNEKDAWRYVLLWDRDTAGQRRFDPEVADHRYPDPHVMQLNLRGWGPMMCELPGLPFRVQYFRAEHSQDVPNAVGVRVECLNADGSAATAVGFTCDTAYFQELCDSSHLGGCDILVAHMSEPDPEEYDNRDHVKEGHLGYRGVERLIKGCKPKLTIVGEFWAGITDLRIDLVQGLRKLCDTEAILPASIGLQVKPGTLEVRCTKCHNWTNLGQIRVSSPNTEFGPLGYHCRYCRLG